MAPDGRGPPFLKRWQQLYFYIESMGWAQVVPPSVGSKFTQCQQAHLESGWADAAFCPVKPSASWTCDSPYIRREQRRWHPQGPVANTTVPVPASAHIFPLGGDGHTLLPGVS